MNIFKTILGLAVLAIGIYMFATNWGPVSPPFLSGIAFIMLGGLHVCGTCKK